MHSRAPPGLDGALLPQYPQAALDSVVPGQLCIDSDDPWSSPPHWGRSQVSAQAAEPLQKSGPSWAPAV